MNPEKMSSLKITIGSDNFRNLVSRDGIHGDLTCLFVDKSKFIADLINRNYIHDNTRIEHEAHVVLITRPRRWGKSTILSMVQHFFAAEVHGKPTRDLFNGLYIANQEAFKEQGQWPVIFISLKDLRGENFAKVLESIAEKISKLYKQHQYIIDALHNKSAGFSHVVAEVRDSDIKKFTAILNMQANQTALEGSLNFLSELLYTYHNKKQVYILIDEYDNAINHAFDNPELLQSLTCFFSNLFSNALKTNEFLKQGLVTGILRVAKANIFSGLSNLAEYTVLDKGFSEHYGFTEAEVATLLQKTGITNATEIKAWYNGYHIGGHTIYNPWSIMQCLSNHGTLSTYWVDTANPNMIKSFWLDKSRVSDKVKIRKLLTEDSIVLNKDDVLKKHVSLEDLQNNPNILWSLLLHTGYITQNQSNEINTVSLPNQEIKILLRDLINNWSVANPIFTRAANTLLNGDVEGFGEALRSALNEPAYSARIFGGGGAASNFVDTIKLKEFIYQFLIMAELHCINTEEADKYQVIAEPQQISAGSTRPDFIVINHAAKLCVVGEIKALDKDVTDKTLDKTANTSALEQARHNEYGIKYLKSGYQLLRIGLAFRGIRFGIAHELIHKAQKSKSRANGKMLASKTAKSRKRSAKPGKLLPKSKASARGKKTKVQKNAKLKKVGKAKGKKQLS